MKSYRNKLPFENKVIWITGASSGIGEQLCYQFAERGAFLILSARNALKLKQVKSQLPSHEDRVFVLPLNLEQLDQLPGKVSQALAHFGRIDYLINNAGVGLRDFALATRLEIDQKIMNVNYFGTIVLTKCLLPHMLERGSGQVVVMSSLSGKYGVPRTSAYAASKHALQGFFETLRSEIAGSGVFITIIMPGIIQTDITAHALVGDGTFFGRVEKTFQSAYPVDKAARKIVKAILKKKEEVFVGGSEGITLFLNRLSPWLLRRFIRSHPIKKVRAIKRRFSFRKTDQ
jgi:dehydrogenase/reductase SDR family protein 7B